MLKWIPAIAALAIASPAVSASQAPPREAKLSVAAADLQDPATAAAFYKRLRLTASEVCDSYAANSRVTQGDAACVERSVAGAVETLNRPALTAVHRDARSGGLAR